MVQYTNVDALRVESNGILVDAGGVTVTAGGLTVTAGGITVSAGGAAITGAVTMSSTLGVTGVITAAAANVITHAPTGLKLQDSDASHLVTIAAGNESADRTLSIPVLGGADTLMTLGTAQSVTGAKTLQAGGAATATYLASGFLNRQVTQVATGANTTETDGHSYTLPANTLSANGRGVRARAWGTTAANANNKTFQFYFGGTSVFTTGAVAANAKHFFLQMDIIREGAGDQRIFISGHFNGSPIVASTVVDGVKDETAALVIKDTITNGTASAGDITVEGFDVEYI